MSSPILSQTVTAIQYTQTTCIDISEDCFFIEELKLNLGFKIKISNRLQKFKFQIPRFWKKIFPPTTRMDLIAHETFQREFQYIQSNTPLIISSDGSKGERRSGESWIITWECGTHIVRGYNPNFGQNSAINSYWAGVYAFLATTLFLYLYYIYYEFPVHNKINALYDIQAYANKLTWIY